LHFIVYIDPTTGLNQHKQYNAIKIFLRILQRFTCHKHNYFAQFYRLYTV